jgi:hypothetical protein
MAAKKINKKVVYKNENLEVYNHMGLPLKKGMFKKTNMLYLTLEDFYYEVKYQLKQSMRPVKKLIGFFNNIYLFRKNLWDHNKYDATESLAIFNTSLKIVAKGMDKVGDNGFNFSKRSSAINETTQIIDKLIKNEYLNITEITNSNLNDLLEKSIVEEIKDFKRLMLLLSNRNYGIMSWWY